MSHLGLPVSVYPRIVIAGGGFGGITLAKALKGKPFQVVLIDRNNFHTFQPLLYQVATGGLEADSIAFPIRKIFSGATNVFFRLAEIKHIHQADKKIETSIGELQYDYLVIATGSTNNFFGNTELEQFCMPLKSLTEALDLRSLILQNFEKAINATVNKEMYCNLVVVGGGPTGVEVAGSLAELKRHVIPNDYPELKEGNIHIFLVESSAEILDNMSDQSSKKAYTFLEKLGVKLILNTKLVSFDGSEAVLSSGQKIPTMTVVWCAGVKGQTIPGLPEIIVQRGNRISVNEFNQAVGCKDIFVIGDLAATKEEKYPNGLPMVAPAAIQQAELLAKNLIRISQKKELLPFSYKDKGSMATIGRNKAVVDIGKIHFQGALAWFTWMAVHLMTLVGFRNKVVVFINWLWNYFSYDRAIRLIVRPFFGKTVKKNE